MLARAPSSSNASVAACADTPSLHDALPISINGPVAVPPTLTFDVGMSGSRSTTTGLVVMIASRSAFSVAAVRSEEHTSELQSRGHLVCRLLLEKKKPSEA